MLSSYVKLYIYKSNINMEIYVDLGYPKQKASK